MNRYNLLLGVLLATLAAAVGFELWPSNRGPREATPRAAEPGATSAAAPSAEPIAAYVDQILARPLFTEGRRPAAVAAVQAPPAGVDKLPRLSGILVTGNDRRAIFESGGKPIVGIVGTPLGAYRILAITPLRVTLQGPAGVQAVSLSYGADAGSTPAAAPPSILDELNRGARPPPGMPKTPTFQEMMANLPKSMPPMVNGLPLNDTRPAR